MKYITMGPNDGRKFMLNVYLYSTRRTMMAGAERCINRNCHGGVNGDVVDSASARCLMLRDCVVDGQKGWTVADIFLNRDDCLKEHGCLVHELTHALDWMTKHNGLDNTVKDIGERRAMTMETIYRNTMLWLKRQDRRLKA